MNLFLMVMLREGDNAVDVIESLCDTLTNARILHPNEKLSFHTVGNNVLVYRSFPTLYGSPEVAEESHHHTPRG